MGRSLDIILEIIRLENLFFKETKRIIEAGLQHKMFQFKRIESAIEPGFLIKEVRNSGSNFYVLD